MGGSLVVPAGFGDDYDSDSPTRYLVEEWFLFYLAANLAAAYEFNEQFSVGLGVAANYGSLDIDSAVRNERGVPDGSMNLDADGFSASFYGGLTWTPIESTRLGFVYRGKVDVDLDGTPEFRGLTPETLDRLAARGVLGQKVEVASSLPPVWGFGINHTLSNGIRFSGDLAYVQFSEFSLAEFAYLDGNRIERRVDYDDVFAFSTAVTMPVTEKWSAGLSFAWLDSPVSLKERSALLRLDRIWLFGTGVEYAWSNGRSLSFNISYTDLGSGRIRSEQLPVLGRIDAKFRRNYALLFDIKLRWAFLRGR